MARSIRIGGAAGFWGESASATAQLLGDPDLDVLIYDYLSEITLSIMARARAKDANAGWAGDFVTAAMAPNLAQIARRGVKVIANAGGMNPAACAKALRAEAARQNIPLRIAVVTGDDLSPRAADFAGAPEMFSGAPFPPLDRIASINAYLGAFPIAAALSAGAQVVITGRCVDSALALGACIHAHGWGAQDLDALAGGSLAGHLIECGPQATGGNFTRWRLVGDPDAIGYPIAEIDADGAFAIGVAPGAGGGGIVAAAAEQMLYEIGDPQAYALPDVICDFSDVRMALDGAPDGAGVRVTGARGRAPSGRLKVCATWADGFRGGQLLGFNGLEAREKAHAFAAAARRRAEAAAGSFAEWSEEITGGAPPGAPDGYEEITLKLAVRHDAPKGVGAFVREVTGLALATPPGLSIFTAGGRPKPSPVVRLFSFLADAAAVPARVTLDGAAIAYADPPRPAPTPPPACPPRPAAPGTATAHAPLAALACARSGDKGDAANIGVIADDPAALPWIRAALTPHMLRAVFPEALGAIRIYDLPGVHAINIVLEDALGGGGIASLRMDAQAKSWAQRLLAHPIPIPANLIPAHGGPS
ncbi:MAG: hypothetical protein ACJAVR_001225 [Paracoccaceae bacterium]|jgi:hypothetical protein